MHAFPAMAALAGFCCALRADTIAQWTFNGTATPSLGAGTALVIGGVTAAYASGSPHDAAGDNTAWNTSAYPPQGTSNKKAGVEIHVSTKGYTDISVSWEQRLSNTATRYLRFQYATNGVAFSDLSAGGVCAMSTLAFERKAQSLAGVSGVHDNPLFAFRLVGEFETTASGAGIDGYVTTYGTNSYSRNGTVRFDLLTVSGVAIQGGNTPPSISRISGQTLRAYQSSVPLHFVVSDLEDPAEELSVVAHVSDPAIVTQVRLSGAGSDREVSLKAGGVPGTSSVSLTARDRGGLSNTTDFLVTVLPTNTPPWISEIRGTNLLAGLTTDWIPFQVGDLETSAEKLIVSGYSANSNLVPNDPTHLTFAGAGTSRAVKISPRAGQAGVAPIYVTVTDGGCAASRSFAVMVRPEESVVLYDPFSYDDGPVCTNSGFLWQHRSGIEGDCHLQDGELVLTGARMEDITALLANGPYVRSNGTTLYASFRLRFLGAPKFRPEYFAHFQGGSASRGRIYAGATDLWPGAFRLYVANGSENFTVVPWNLSTNTTYTVVTRYDVDSAKTTLWLNPSGTPGAGTTALDMEAPVSVTGYAFRQDAGLGATVLVDDLRVGRSYEAVIFSPPASGPRLALERDSGKVVLRWNAPGYLLQTSSWVGTGFQDVYGATSPFTNVLGASPQARFFRLRRQF